MSGGVSLPTNSIRRGWYTAKTHVSIRSLNVDQPYYFTVEAFDVHGVGAKSAIIEAR